MSEDQAVRLQLVADFLQHRAGFDVNGEVFRPNLEHTFHGSQGRGSGFGFRRYVRRPSSRCRRRIPPAPSRPRPLPARTPRSSAVLSRPQHGSRGQRPTRRALFARPPRSMSCPGWAAGCQVAHHSVEVRISPAQARPRAACRWRQLQSYAEYRLPFRRSDLRRTIGLSPNAADGQARDRTGRWPALSTPLTRTSRPMRRCDRPSTPR